MASYTDAWYRLREMITCSVCKCSMQRRTLGIHLLSMKHLKAVDPRVVFADGYVKLSKRIDCTCGLSIGRYYHKAHLKTAKHIEGVAAGGVIIKPKIELCICGSMVKSYYRSRHAKTAKHRRAVLSLKA